MACSGSSGALRWDQHVALRSQIVGATRRSRGSGTLDSAASGAGARTQRHIGRTSGVSCLVVFAVKWVVNARRHVARPARHARRLAGDAGDGGATRGGVTRADALARARGGEEREWRRSRRARRSSAPASSPALRHGAGAASSEASEFGQVWMVPQGHVPLGPWGGARNQSSRTQLPIYGGICAIFQALVHSSRFCAPRPSVRQRLRWARC